MLTRNVNGIDVALSPEEEAAVLAEWAKNDPANLPPDPLRDGIDLEFSRAPALSGRYAIDVDAQRSIAAIAAGIAARNRVPGGAATFEYPDCTGTPHSFTGAQFLDFASAVEDFVYSLSRGESPAQPVTVP